MLQAARMRNVLEKRSRVLNASRTASVAGRGAHWIRYQALMLFLAPSLVLTDCAKSVDSYSSSHETQPAHRILPKAVGRKEPHTALSDSATYHLTPLSSHDR